MPPIIRNLNLYRQIHSPSFLIEKATANHRTEIWRLMKDIFYKNDPSSMYSKVSEVPKLSNFVQNMTLESLDENLSLVAKDNKSNEIFGVAINGTRPVALNNIHMEEFLEKIKSGREKTLLELWKFLSCMPPDPEKYFSDVKNVFEVRYLVVDPAYRGKGIGTALVTNSRKEAVAQGHKYIRIDCTSHFTARIAMAAGLTCIYELYYADYRNSKGELVFHNIIVPHTKICVYAGKI